jgi:hypothetical protein
VTSTEFYRNSRRFQNAVRRGAAGREEKGGEKAKTLVRDVNRKIKAAIKEIGS